MNQTGQLAFRYLFLIFLIANRTISFSVFVFNFPYSKGGFGLFAGIRAIMA